MTTRLVPQINGDWYDVLAAVRGPDIEPELLDYVNKQRSSMGIRIFIPEEWKNKYTMRIRRTLGLLSDEAYKPIDSPEEARRLIDEIVSLDWIWINHYASHVFYALLALAKLLTPEVER